MRTFLFVCLLAVLELACVTAKIPPKPSLNQMKKVTSKMWNECKNGKPKLQPLHDLCAEMVKAGNLVLETEPADGMDIHQIIEGVYDTLNSDRVFVKYPKPPAILPELIRPIPGPRPLVIVRK